MVLRQWRPGPAEKSMVGPRASDVAGGRRRRARTSCSGSAGLPRDVLHRPASGPFPFGGGLGLGGAGLPPGRGRPRRTSQPVCAVLSRPGGGGGQLDPDRDQKSVGGMALCRWVYAALLLLAALGRSDGGESASSRIVFGGAWARARVRAPSAASSGCGAACQAERSKAESVCLLPDRDAGWRCGDDTVRYSYVVASNSCVPFLYGGCRGNANNFVSFAQCSDRCKTTVKPARRPSSTSSVSSAVSRVSPWGATSLAWSRPQWGRPTSGWTHGGFRTGFQPVRSSGKIHFEVGPRRGTGVGPRRGTGVGPRRGTGVGPRRGTGVEPRRGTGVGPRRGTGVGPRRGTGVGPRRGTEVGPRRGGVGPRRGGGLSSRSSLFFPTFQSQEPDFSGTAQHIRSRRSCQRPSHEEGWPCASSPVVRYTYLTATNSCVPFQYGGCGGSSNNFASFDLCRDTCKAPAPLLAARQADSRIHFPGVGPRMRGDVLLRRRCRQSWQAGPCRGFGPMMRYFYDPERRGCRLALYSGCGGNSNRFLSRRTCERVCGSV